MPTQETLGTPAVNQDPRGPTPVSSEAWTVDGCQVAWDRQMEVLLRSLSVKHRTVRTQTFLQTK